MCDQKDETAELYRIYGDFLHEVPEAESAVRKAFRIARMRDVAERGNKGCGDRCPESVSSKV